MIRFLKLCSVVFAGLLATGCATTPSLHVIGVYEGQTSSGGDARPWWAKCKEGQEGKPRSSVPMQALSECQQKVAGIQAEKEVAVNVGDDNKPVILVLTAYDRTLWKVSQKPGDAVWAATPEHQPLMVLSKEMGSMVVINYQKKLQPGTFGQSTFC